MKRKEPTKKFRIYGVYTWWENPFMNFVWCFACQLAVMLLQCSNLWWDVFSSWTCSIHDWRLWWRGGSVSAIHDRTADEVNKTDNKTYFYVIIYSAKTHPKSRSRVWKSWINPMIWKLVGWHLTATTWSNCFLCEVISLSHHEEGIWSTPLPSFCWFCLWVFYAVLIRSCC